MASGCDQCVGSVGLVTGCGQWVEDLLILITSCHCSNFLIPSSLLYDQFNFVNCILFLFVFFGGGGFLNM